MIKKYIFFEHHKHIYAIYYRSTKTIYYNVNSDSNKIILIK